MENLAYKLPEKLDEIAESTSASAYITFARSIRIHHWVKNILICVPFLVAHRFNSHLLLIALLAFLSFSLCASSAYLLNDLLDLDADRAHSKKKSRPLAAGDLPINVAMLLIPLFFGLSFFLAHRLSIAFTTVLALYLVTTTLYSIYLKQVIVVDVLVLASLYSLRLLAGGIAEGIHVSLWLMTFSMFLFFSLACVKRFAELLSVKDTAVKTLARRGYNDLDLEQMSQLGSASGFISVLVLALYINSTEVTKLYHHPAVLMMICPLLMYWIARIWLLARRGEVHQDPFVFAIGDRSSYVVAISSALIMYWAL